MKKSPYIILAATILLLLSGCSVNSTRNSSALSKSSSVITPSSSVVSPSSSVSTPSSSVSTPSSSELKSAIFGDVTNYTISSSKTCTDKRFKFSVDYPSAWTAVVDKVNLPTSSSNGDPDCGVSIYVEGNKNECIYVFEQNGPMHESPNFNTHEDFITKDMVRGKLSYKLNDGAYDIDLLLYENDFNKEYDQSYHSASLHLSKACFTRNKAQILGILKSIRLG